MTPAIYQVPHAYTRPDWVICMHQLTVSVPNTDIGCSTCGKPAEGRGNRPRFCNDKCRDEANYQMKKILRETSPPKMGTCGHCGKMFRKIGIQLYCRTQCRDRARTERRAKKCQLRI